MTEEEALSVLRFIWEDELCFLREDEVDLVRWWYDDGGSVFFEGVERALHEISGALFNFDKFALKDGEFPYSLF